MSSGNELRNVIRDDERRRHDEVRVTSLQSQLDEMRSLVRELVNRQSRSEHQFKKYEAGLAELRTAIEQRSHEQSQASQARQIEEARIRQQLVELDERIDAGMKPIRALQAHVAEVLESIRRERDDDQAELRRYEELRSVIESVAAIAERNIDVSNQLRDSIEGLRAEHAQTQRDVAKVDDSVRITEQDARRRVKDVALEIENIEARLIEISPQFDQIEARIDDLRDSIKHIDPALDELQRHGELTREEIGRLYSQSSERDESLSERIDEVRVQFDAADRDVRQSVEHTNSRFNERFDQAGDDLRELSYRINIIEMRLEELQDTDIRTRRELWHLNEMGIRRRLDQVQSELEQLVDQRRAVEGELTENSRTKPETGSKSGGVD